LTIPNTKTIALAESIRNIKNVVCRYVAKMERTVSTIRSPINRFSSARDKRKEEVL
jgi:hypothetical protein